MGVLCLVLLISFRTAQPLPLTRPSTFTTLEWALRRVLQEITCRELTALELKQQFRNNNNISFDVQVMLKKIDIQDQEDCKRARPLYFLDYRRGIHPNCTSHSLPRLQLIESVTPVFPAYYMDWECGGDCSEETFQVRNYELLQRTNQCTQGTADWTSIEAATSHRLNVTRRCIFNHQKHI